MAAEEGSGAFVQAPVTVQSAFRGNVEEGVGRGEEWRNVGRKDREGEQHSLRSVESVCAWCVRV